mgnify:CR=1 FL=1
MSFYTALTGLNGSQADISATSNNIANVATTGYKRSKAEFGDIFATSPLQNSSSSIGSGTILKGIKQQFTQGNVSSSLNALDMAISGQGFFALKPSLTTNQTVYTRNGSFSVNNLTRNPFTCIFIFKTTYYKPHLAMHELCFYVLNLFSTGGREGRVYFTTPIQFFKNALNI